MTYTDCIDHGRKGNARGYASCYHDGKYISVHVRALIQKTGELPDGRVARHLCDNPRCINQDHLTWGTQADNIRDTVGKFGSRATSGRVLTDQEVQEIRELRASTGASHRAIAARFGVGRVTITQILSGARR